MAMASNLIVMASKLEETCVYNFPESHGLLSSKLGPVENV